MASISLASAVRVFPCPHCRETINTTVQQCPFCGAPIDHAAAEASAAETARISSAVSDASYLRTMLFLLLPFFGIMFLPFLSLLGIVGLWFLKIAIPVMCIRWWIKYRGIRTTDPDFFTARRNAILVSGVWLLVAIFMHGPQILH